MDIVSFFYSKFYKMDEYRYIPIFQDGYFFGYFSEMFHFLSTTYLLLPHFYLSFLPATTTTPHTTLRSGSLFVHLFAISSDLLRVFLGSFIDLIGFSFSCVAVYWFIFIWVLCFCYAHACAVPLRTHAHATHRARARARTRLRFYFARSLHAHLHLPHTLPAAHTCTHTPRTPATPHATHTHTLLHWFWFVLRTMRS